MSLFAELTSGVNAVRPGRTTMPNFDLSVIVAASALVLLGLLMVYSASIALADGPRYESYGRYYFVIRHALFIVLGVVGLAFVLGVPMRVWEKLAVPLFLFSLLLLIVVLIPGVGREVNGARRWLPLGPLNLDRKSVV